MEVFAIIVALFGAVLAVERKSEDSWRLGPNRPIEAYIHAKKAGKTPVIERGRFTIFGKHGDYKIREKTPKGNATYGSVYNIRQAKEWLWCLDQGYDYDTVKRAYRNMKGRASREARLERQRRAQRRRDVALQAAEMGLHNFSTDSEGNRTYYASEWGTRSRGYGSRGYSYYDDDPYY